MRYRQIIVRFIFKMFNDYLLLGDVRKFHSVRPNTIHIKFNILNSICT